MNELIDYEIIGNAIRLYFGKNREQWGDDWDDVPYEHNAGIVYDKYVKKVIDMLIDCDYWVIEPCDAGEESNSQYSRQDFRDKKVWAFMVQNTKKVEFGEKVYFGDTLEEVGRKARAVCIHVKKVNV